MVKAKVHSHSEMTTEWLAGADSTYLFCYAIGNIISGFLEDRLPLRLLIAGGVITSGLLYSVIIILGYSNAYIPYVFVIQFALQGILQSTVWPGCVAVLGNWFTREHRGKIMGLWSSCGSVGNIIGALAGGAILTSGQDWMVVTSTFAAFQIVIGVVYFATVSDYPKNTQGTAKLIDQEVGTSVNSLEEIKHLNRGHKEGMPFMEALRLPGVIAFSLNFACVKSLYYGLSMWLPYFLTNRINHKEWVGTMAALLNVGAVLGSIVCGWLGDYYKYRPPIIAAFLVLSWPFLILLEVGSESIFWMYFIVIPIVGFLVAGASNIIASAVAADLSQNPEIGGKTEAMATVAGIIDGAGGIGAAFCTFIIGFLSNYEWVYVFLFMVLLAILAVLSIARITYRDLLKIKKSKQKKRISF